MTELDDETLEAVATFRSGEDRSESQMIAILVREAVAARRSPSRLPQPSPGNGE